MRLKLYRAACVTEAIANVRRDLGADALILSTRRVGVGVEVTAALEIDDDDAPPHEMPSGPRRRQVDAARTKLLSFHAVRPPLADDLNDGELTDALAGALRFAPGPWSRPGPVLFAGGPGAGKTLTAARLATRLVIAGVTPAVLTADAKRAGAAAQLAAFTRLLGIDLIVADTPLLLTKALRARRGAAPMLIDAPGCDPFDPDQRDEFAALAALADAEPVLVMASGGDPVEAAELGSAFAELGARHLIATRLDVGRRLGGILHAAAAGRLILTEAGIGPGVADGLVPMTPELLAARLERYVAKACTTPPDQFDPTEPVTGT